MSPYGKANVVVCLSGFQKRVVLRGRVILTHVSIGLIGAGTARIVVFLLLLDGNNDLTVLVKRCNLVLIFYIIMYNNII